MVPFYTTDFGNPSSSHPFGWRAKEAVEAARASVGRLVGASAREIVFTSGATEANNLAIRGLAARHAQGHIITVATEHPAILDVCASVGGEGIEITRLPVDAHGQVDPEQIRQNLRDDTFLVSVMAANNEVGTIHRLQEIGAVVARHPALWHCDAAQAIGKIPIDVDALGIDLLSMSAHKLYGPKGQGALFVRRRRPAIRLRPMQEGGGQERGLRSGTLNVPGIVGLGVACELAESEMTEEIQRLLALRERLVQQLQESLSSVRVNGHPDQHLPGCLSVCFSGTDGRDLMLRLQNSIALSAGAACSAGHDGPSHVLRAMGHSDEDAASTLRFGLGRTTTQEQIDTAADCVVKACRQGAPLAS
jgi:cysteine desulfurase